MSATKLEFFKSPAEAWKAMEQDCLSAQKSIEFEQYIIRDDSVGLKFLKIFIEKAKQGVSIRLILDRIGSRTLYSSMEISELIRHGGQVHFYNKINLFNILLPNTWFPRNHSKLMLIDQTSAYVGSVCFSEDMHDWRDTHAKVTGDLVRQIETYFAKAWQSISMRRITKKLAKESRGQLYSFLAATPRLRRNPIYLELLASIRSAKKEIYLVTPYFMPPFLLKKAMMKAAKRGVQVKIMMSAKSDVPIADYVAHTYFKKLMCSGITILLYKKTILHAKYAAVDDNWATLGSTNLDYLSLRKNRETNIIIREQDKVAELKKHFHDDEGDCFRVDEKFLETLPVYQKILGYFGRTFKRIL